MQYHPSHYSYWKSNHIAVKPQCITTLCYKRFKPVKTLRHMKHQKNKRWSSFKGHERDTRHSKCQIRAEAAWRCVCCSANCREALIKDAKHLSAWLCVHWEPQSKQSLRLNLLSNETYKCWTIMCFAFVCLLVLNVGQADLRLYSESYSHHLWWEQSWSGIVRKSLSCCCVLETVGYWFQSFQHCHCSVCVCVYVCWHAWCVCVCVRACVCVCVLINLEPQCCWFIPVVTGLGIANTAI